MNPVLVYARNASEWTGPTGNNTWLIPGREPALIDAGVGHPDHVGDIARALSGAALARILVTHGHPDHVGGIPALRARWPSVVVVQGPSEGGGQQTSVPAGDGVLEVVSTPGHAPDHVCYFDPASRDLFCGDMARRGGTIVIPAAQGGNLREYLASLERIRTLRPARLLPGHGPIVDDPSALIDEYIAHRRLRSEQIAAALAGGARTVEEIVEKVYPGISSRLHRAAEETVAAHLEDLEDARPRDGGRS
jgi:glyoxylase-like metal-dependent hydrolase (beta-lactamase superfamily II)